MDGAWLESGEFISTCHGDDRLGGGNVANAADGNGARFLWLQAHPLGFFLLPLFFVARPCLCARLAIAAEPHHRF